MHTEVVIHLMNAYCGVGAKSVAHLMKFYLLQWEVMKVKFLINSNMNQQCLICIKRQTQRSMKILKVKVTMTR